jgi:nitric oxide reductase subunit C
MTLPQGKAIFIWGTVISAVIFLVLTYDSLVQMPKRTQETKLTAQVAAGKWVWQKYNCNDCHTILGIGGYYAPDVTKVMSTRDKEWVTSFLKDPERVWPNSRKMPNLHMKEQEISDLAAFLDWVNGIDTNNWPPKPMVATAVTSLTFYREQAF